MDPNYDSTVCYLYDLKCAVGLSRQSPKLMKIPKIIPKNHPAIRFDFDLEIPS